MKTALVLVAVLAAVCATELKVTPLAYGALPYAGLPLAYSGLAAPYAAVPYAAALPYAAYNYPTMMQDYRMQLDTTLPGSAYANFPNAAFPTAYGYGVLKKAE